MDRHIETRYTIERDDDALPSDYLSEGFSRHIDLGGSDDHLFMNEVDEHISNMDINDRSKMEENIIPMVINDTQTIGLAELSVMM